MNDAPIINRVDQSGLITINLEDYFHPGEKIEFDLKNNLFQELILKEKDFREFVKTHPWEKYSGKNVALFCSADAIIPTWAFMLVASKLQPYAHLTVFGSIEDVNRKIFSEAISNINEEKYRDAKVVIKGCSKIEVPVSAYVELTNKLLPVVKSIMYGEPCSTVPVYKNMK